MLHADVVPRRADLRAMADLALPVVGVQVGIMLMGVADTIMVGHVSRQALASAALGNLYFFVCTIFGMGVLMALDPVVSQAVGARDEEAIARAMQRGLLMALGLTVVGFMLILPAEPLLRMARQPAEIVPDAVRYARICVPGFFPFFAFIVLRQSLQAMARIRPVLLSVVAANLLNVGLNWILIFGHFGFPPLGVPGAAWATTVSRWAMALLLLFVSYKRLRPYLAPWRPASLDLTPLLRMVRLGVPIGAQYSLEYGAFAVSALLMGVIGTTAMAAHQVAINLASFTFMVPFGVSAATAVLVGHAIGAGDEARARRAAVGGLALGSGFMLLSAAAFLSIPRLLARVYSSDELVISLAASLIPIAGVFQVFDGVQAVAGGVLRGVGDTQAPAVINVLGFWLVGLPTCALFAFVFDGGAIGLWWGIVAGLGVVAILLLARVRARLGRTLHRVVIDERGPNADVSERMEGLSSES